MFVVTFYSYKGGVGRTSALANVAYRLASKGKRVFVLDFDVEAPGIDAYQLWQSSEPHQGIVEYIGEFTRTGQVPPIQDYVLQAKLPRTMDRLFVMPAGKKDDAYKSEIGRLDWKIFYKQKRGYLFIENLKAQVKDVFKPDYMLIDSRTGLTDVSGICTLQLPHLVVLLFSLNEQNVEGTSQVFRSIRDNKLNRSIATLLVASPVPDMPEWVAVRSERFEHARKIIGKTVDVVIPYNPFMAFRESIISRQESEESKSYLGEAYDELCQSIVKENEADVLTLLRKATALRDEGNYELAELRYREVIETCPDSPEAWVAFGKFARLRGNSQQACEFLEKAKVLRPDDPQIYAHLAMAYATTDKSLAAQYYNQFIKLETDVEQIARVSEIIRNLGLAEVAVEGFEQVIGQKPDRLESYIDLGETQMRLRRYREAAQTYQRAMAVSPTNLVCVYNAGYALSRVGDARAVELFSKAIQIWEQKDKSELTPSIMTNYHAAMSNAYLGTGQLDKAVEHLQKALVLATGLEKTRIFSTKQYKEIPQAAFVREIEEELAKVRRQLDESVILKASGLGPADLN
jgi:tetratricopeptide (TPR) repeat protein